MYVKVDGARKGGAYLQQQQREKKKTNIRDRRRAWYCNNILYVNTEYK